MKTHRMAGTRFYKIWKGMKTRCLNRNYQKFKDYGGRGIKICVEWLTFEGFKNDLYRKYQLHVRKHGEIETNIERIDNDGNYEKKNVRWATREEQNKNKRMFKLTRTKVADIRARYVRGNGRYLAREYGVTPAVISEVVNKKRNYANY